VTHRPLLAAFRGLPGTGKSFLVRRLVREKAGLLVLSRDALRAAMIAEPVFSRDEKDLVDDVVTAMAGFLLGRGRSVVIDGMALSSAARVEQLASVAEAADVPFRLVECVCSERTALARIAGDAGAHPAADRGEALYFEVRDRFQVVTRPFLRIDTDRDPEENLRAILEYLQSGPPWASLPGREGAQ
jgi:predicted kinase